MKIYIAGPITGTEDAVKRFHGAEVFIRWKGHEAVNPIYIGYLITTTGENAISYGNIMNICKALLGACDAVYMMPGWQRSNGARIEHAEAIKKGLRFYASLDAIPETEEAKERHRKNDGRTRQNDETRRIFED